MGERPIRLSWKTCDCHLDAFATAWAIDLLFKMVSNRHALSQLVDNA